jgi:hypothetical protein
MRNIEAGQRIYLSDTRVLTSPTAEKKLQDLVYDQAYIQGCEDVDLPVGEGTVTIPVIPRGADKKIKPRIISVLSMGDLQHLAGTPLINNADVYVLRDSSLIVLESIRRGREDMGIVKGSVSDELLEVNQIVKVTSFTRKVEGEEEEVTLIARKK